MGYGGGEAARGGGGRTRNMAGAPHSVTRSEHLLADNGKLHEEVLACFAELFAGNVRVDMPALRP